VECAAVRLDDPLMSGGGRPFTSPRAQGTTQQDPAQTSAFHVSKIEEIGGSSSGGSPPRAARSNPEELMFAGRRLTYSPDVALRITHPGNRSRTPFPAVFSLKKDK
jgi:hypothetical protein